MEKNMTRKILFSKDDYNRYFKPKEYVREWADPSMMFYSDALSRLFKTGVVKGSTYLEYGSGPVMAPIAAVCEYVDEITMAELTQQNRDEVNKWLENKKDSLNWDEHIKHTLSMEGKSTTDVKARKSAMRSKVAKVIPCEGALTNPLYPICEKFDVVGSSLMLEAVFHETLQLKDFIKYAGNLVKTNGYIVEFGSTGCPYWRCGEVYYKGYMYTREAYIEGYTDAGLDIIEITEFDVEYSDENPDAKGPIEKLLLIVARKP